MRVLVVEDDTNLNRQIKEALTDAGYAVDVAFDGEEGHFLGDTEPYDAVVLDIGLPRLDGFSVAQRLRALSAFDRTLIVGASGYNRESDRHHQRSPAPA